MPVLQNTRRVAALATDLDALRGNCEQVSHTLAGAAILFSVAAALVVFGGVWTGQPLFAMSSAFAVTAAVVFASSARMLSHTARAAPRIAAVAAPRFDPRQVWGRAA